MNVEWLILADAAQVIGNKLYLLGGGWDRMITNGQFPISQKMALALSIRVPWDETNETHTFEMEILTEDQGTGQPKSLMKAGGQFQVGRPAGMPLGQEQRFQLAIDMVLKIENPGPKTVVARVDGKELQQTSFFVSAQTT